ncbi:polysaccharide deacetylase family protein [Ornithinibacillus halophilus]|uniref:Polysaccharide deacetylase family sporulation protein PdaB n=1 Tax=Ornithinibacillus halophilus TaxID=930117 RepID=A0A1M5JTF1_9BACI|nr:polysaccharide deacetylase family protein [Ornithinibacillus halophilus]SHG43826.1 polysaccharide deacetylase family sporulation protein PdaB [Ornithinibacillus halophilus]
MKKARWKVFIGIIIFFILSIFIFIKWTDIRLLATSKLESETPISSKDVILGMKGQNVVQKDTIVIPVKENDQIETDPSKTEPIVELDDPDEVSENNDNHEQDTEKSSEKEESIVEINNEEKYVALTFDDGPTPDFTPQILEILKNYDAKATFFMLGVQVKQHPQIVQQVADADHEIGNHTQNHVDLTKISSGEIREELTKSNQQIKEASGDAPSLIRPPFGVYNNNLEQIASENNTSIIMWSVDTRDWERNPSYVVDTVKKKVKSGSIVLMHDTKHTTVEALPEVMNYLKKNGYQFVTVSELLALQTLNGIGPFYGNK